MSDPTPILETRSLTKSFTNPTGDALEVLRGVTFSVMPGDTLSIRGESGSGKSTLLNILAALENPTTGEVLLQGENIFSKPGAWQSRQRAALYGFVFQAYYLVPELNALENVLLAQRILGPLKDQHRSRARALLERVGMSERMDFMPMKLSGGERQRVAVARALLNQPSLVLADEPTGNLDEKTAGRVIELLLGMCAEEGAALVLVTHNPDFAARCAHRTHLHDGQLHAL